MSAIAERLFGHDLPAQGRIGHLRDAAGRDVAERMLWSGGLRNDNQILALGDAGWIGEG